MILSFAMQKLLSFLRTHLLMVDLSAYTVFYSESLFPCLWVQGVSHCSNRFSVTGSMLGFLILLDLSFVQWYVWIHLDSSMYSYLVWPASFVEDAAPPICISGFFIKNLVFISVCIYVWVFKLIPSINVSDFRPTACRFLIYHSSVEHEIGGC